MLQSGTFILSGTSRKVPVKCNESFCLKKVKKNPCEIRNFQYFQKLNFSLAEVRLCLEDLSEHLGFFCKSKSSQIPQALQTDC